MQRKKEEMIQLFINLKKPEEKYKKLIELGKEQTPFKPELKTESNRVHG